MTDFTCKVDEEYLSACKGLPEYQDTGYCVLHFPGEGKTDAFEEAKQSKLAQKDYDFSGAVFPEGASDFEGAKFDADANFTGARFLGNANFSGAQFSGELTSFSDAQFSGELTDFTNVDFSGEWTDFTGAQFSGADTSFVYVQFSGRLTDFSGAQFSGEETYFSASKFSSRLTDFSDTQFSGRLTDFSGFPAAKFSGEGTYFVRTQFSSKETFFVAVEFGSTETIFQEVAFTEHVAFGSAAFRDTVAFWGTKENPVFGSQAQVYLNRIRIDKPELLTFDTVLLHPGWFINADVRKVDFTDVKWYGMPSGPVGTLDNEIAALKDIGVESPHVLLSQACRRLSANAEENREYPLANEFLYWSMDALRIGSWSVIYEALLKEEVRQHIKEEEQRDIKFKDLKPKALDVRALLREDTRDRVRGRRRFGGVNSLYWVLSGYGVRAGRALRVLVTIAVVFAVLYMIVGHASLRVLPIEDNWQILADAGRAVMYSLGVMARLRPEPIPQEMGLFQILVTVEGILGPLQIALLALAVRRKVMR